MSIVNRRPPMSKFRSKPVEIEAVQLTPQRLADWRAGVERLPNGVEIDRFGLLFCRTRQGAVAVVPDDWIIQESDGSGCYPCKPDVFAAKYEPLP
jgi:hypothetical protein